MKVATSLLVHADPKTLPVEVDANTSAADIAGFRSRGYIPEAEATAKVKAESDKKPPKR